MRVWRARGLALAVAGVLILSFDALLIRAAGAPLWDVVFWRGLLMAVTLGALVVWFHGRRAPQRWRTGGWTGWACGALFGLNSVLFVFAVLNTQTANVLVLFSSAPLFSALFTRLFTGEPVAGRTWAVILAVLLGVFLVVQGSLAAGGVRGDLAALAAAVVMGANLTLLRSRPAVDRFAIVATGGVVSAVLATAGAAPLVLGLESYLVLGLMGFVQIPAALVLIAQATRYLPSADVSLILLLEALFGPVWVWIAFAEIPPAASILGGGVILMALAVHFSLSIWEGGRDEPAGRS